jgi:hypothetical protein
MVIGNFQETELNESAVGNATFFWAGKAFDSLLTGKAVGERGSKPSFGVGKASGMPAPEGEKIKQKIRTNTTFLFASQTKKENYANHNRGGPQRNIFLGGRVR